MVVLVAEIFNELNVSVCEILNNAFPFVLFVDADWSLGNSYNTNVCRCLTLWVELVNIASAVLRIKTKTNKKYCENICHPRKYYNARVCACGVRFVSAFFTFVFISLSFDVCLVFVCVCGAICVVKQ